MPRTEDDVLLRIAWPEGAEGRLHGGPVMLTVRGNRVLYRRQPASGPHWTRAVLTGPNMEAFFAALRGLPRVPSGGYPCEVWIGEEQTESFQVAEAELLMQLQQLPEKAKARSPKRIEASLVLQDGGTEPGLPWPRHLVLPSELGPRYELTMNPLSTAQAKTTVKALAPGTVYTTPQGLYRVERLVTHPR